MEIMYIYNFSVVAILGGSEYDIYVVYIVLSISLRYKNDIFKF